MYLGQLLDDGVAAATCTRQGLAIIEFQAAHGDADAEDRMCGACCALVEQLLATADDVEDVAEECDSLLRRASEADPSSAEPLQVMASLRSQQGRSEEALEALRQSIAQWRSRRGGRDVDPDAEDGEDMAEEHMGEYDVSFEFRFETAKLLLELDENTDEAIDVLEELLNERDDVVDVWHLLALANHGCCNFDKALELLNHAEQLNESQGGDEGVVADLMELRAAVTESKEKWNEEVGEDHRMGGGQRLTTRYPRARDERGEGSNDVTRVETSVSVVKNGSVRRGVPGRGASAPSPSRGDPLGDATSRLWTRARRGDWAKKKTARVYLSRAR